LSDSAREYELVLMLDPEIPDERREQIASEAKGRIESSGTLKHDMGWGVRKLAYEIRQRTEADYRLFRFETDGEVLDDLDHNLRIADGVLRFRIFRVDPDTPAIVPPPAMTTSGGTQARGGRRPAAAAEPTDSTSDGEDAGPGDEAEETGETSEEASPTPSSEAEGAEAAGEEQADEAIEEEQSDEAADASPEPESTPQAES
jgi:small subunit ribosomal protein S6